MSFDIVPSGLFPVSGISPDIEVRFVFPGEPLAKERPRFNRKTGSVYTPTATRNAEKAIGAAYLALEDAKKFETPVTVECVFYCFKQSKRDVDNMVKLVLDGLNGIAYSDDYVVWNISGRRVQVETEAQARTYIAVKTNNSDNFERQTDEYWQKISQTS